jgi:hypothetical protein
MLLSGCVPGPSTAVEQVAGRAHVRTVLFQFTGKVGCPVDWHWQSLFKLTRKHGRDFKLNAPTTPPYDEQYLRLEHQLEANCIFSIPPLDPLSPGSSFVLVVAGVLRAVVAHLHTKRSTPGAAQSMELQEASPIV